jgi:raffinose synthase
MKKYLVFFLLISTQCLYAQILDIVNDPNALSLKWGGIERLTGGKVVLKNDVADTHPRVLAKSTNGVAILSVGFENAVSWAADEVGGIYFNNQPDYLQGVCLWRYKPWNSWSKPIALTAASAMPDWDVQFFYWQYADGLYGAALPMSGNGCRTTLGSESGHWGSKAMAYSPESNLKSIPAMAVAFGKDPFELFERIYRTALEAMGRSSNLQSHKKYPEPFNYIGWCSWNSSDNGKNLDEKLVVDAVKTFTDHPFRLGWVLIDDGWFQQKNQQLESFYPDPVKFPNGFKPMISRLKQDYGLKYAGIWHAFDGYWNGIDPDGELGKRYAGQLFSWEQQDGKGIRKYYFIKPTSDSLKKFFDAWHRYFKEQGFDFVKVDNQLVSERMAVNNYPIFQLSDSIHKAIYRSVNKYFNGAIINCMDMTADAYLNFANTAVARGVEDFFPYKQGETYNLQAGNAAAHVLQAVYNNIYFSQMVFSDFDMFQSHHPDAAFHAIARALNNGPIYLTDIPGKQHFDILDKLVYSDGRIVHSQTALLPTPDCLFQVQAMKPFKAWSKVRNTGLLGIWNAADTNKVSGSFKPSDVINMPGMQFALYEHFSSNMQLAFNEQDLSVSLDRLGYQLYYVVPVYRGFAAFGLTNKYNAPATILKEAWDFHGVNLGLYEGGSFKAYAVAKPSHVLVNGKNQDFEFENNQIRIDIPAGKNPQLRIEW